MNSEDIKTDSLWLMKGDCLERMKLIPDGSVDLILTDPPYDISNSGGGMMGKSGRKFIEQIDSMGMCRSGFDVKSFLETTKRFFKGGCYNGLFFCSLKQLNAYLNFAIENKYQYGVTLWHKSDPTPLCNNKYLNDVEWCIYIKQSGKKIKGSYATKSLVYKSSTNRADKKLYNHPTIKPQSLLFKYLENHSDVGDVVFDPFMGSGSAGVACMNTNRKFVGIEMDDNYFNIAAKRILETTKHE